MCAHVCGSLRVRLFGVCRCRRPPGDPRMLKPSTTTISLRLAEALRRTIARHVMHKFTEENIPLLVIRNSWRLRVLVAGFATSRPLPALLFPPHPFIKWNGLLNRALCRADLFMFFFFFFPPFLKAVINIINIWWYFAWPCREWHGEVMKVNAGGTRWLNSD